MGVCNCSMFCCTLLYVHFSIAIILMGKRELIALLNLSSWCLVMVERLFLTVPRGCLQFVIVVFPDHTHLIFLSQQSEPLYLYTYKLPFQKSWIRPDIMIVSFLVYGFLFACWVMPRSHIHGSPRRFYYRLNLTDDPGNANFRSSIRMHYIHMIKYYYL